MSTSMTDAKQIGFDREARRSVPERIADSIDYEIAAQTLAMGERLVETQIAERLQVSRGSVREALRLLASRGSVDLTPQRGAVVTGYSLDRMADVFAVGGMLMALAARYVARHRHADSLRRIGERVARVEAMAARGFSPPLDFATALGGVTAAIVVESGNPVIRAEVSAVLNRSVWRAMWEHPCDHLTIERQRDEAAFARRLLEAIGAGEADLAEYELRRFQQRLADQVTTELARQRGERAPASPPLGPESARLTEDNNVDRLARIEAKLDALSDTSAPLVRRTMLAKVR
jgi:DNA-binding GntR family transcriptional regulator